MPTTATPLKKSSNHLELPKATAPKALLAFLPLRPSMFRFKKHFYAHCVFLIFASAAHFSLQAAPPKAIRVEPLGVAPGQESELILHGTSLASPTGLLTTLDNAQPQSSITLRGNAENASSTPTSKLAASEPSPEAIIIEAEDYSRGQYRKSGIFILNGNFKPNYAEYEFDVQQSGSFQLELKYAAGESRPVKLFLNGRLLTDEAAAGVTGGFGDSDAKWMPEGVIALRAGKNVLRLERPGGTPHFDKVGLVSTNQPATRFSSAKPSDRVAPLQASISGKCPIGIYGLRVATEEGISNPLLFMVDDLPTLNSLRDNHAIETAQPVVLPTAIDGVTESGKADYFQFSGTADQWVSVEAVATRLGTKLDPVIRVLDQAGRELAFVDDSPALSGDCHLRIQLPKTGTYFVAVEDSAMGGNSAYAYRLRIGDFPLRRQTDFARLAGSNLQQFKYSNENPSASPDLGGGFSGQFNDAQSVHRFRFSARKNDRLSLVDRSREFGAAAMLGLAIRDEAGKLIGENHKAGTSGGSLTVTIPSDGSYAADLSELAQRSGPDYAYYAELRRSLPDFELTLETASVILPLDGYAIVKVTANRKGYNGPIRLTASADGKSLAVANEIIAEKKKDTRLKIYIPDDMKPGQPLSLQISGTTETSQSDSNETPIRRYASTLPVLRKAMPQTPHPPFELRSELAVVVGPAIPDFFSLSLDGGVVYFPRHVGEVYFTVRVKDRVKGFKDQVALRVEGLPEGFSAGGGERAVSRSDNNEYRFQLRGPAETKAETREIQIIGEATFKGQTKEVTLTKLPFRIIEPLIITATTKGNARPGSKHKVSVKARRFVPRAGGDMKAITLKLADAPAGFTISDGGLIPAAKNGTTIEVTIAPNVRPGTYNLTLEAANEVAGNKFTVKSSPFQIIVAAE